MPGDPPPPPLKGKSPIVRWTLLYPVPLVESILEGMASVKMNVLHFHLSEECFRIESKMYPTLTDGCVVNGYNNTAAYSREVAAVVLDWGVSDIPPVQKIRHDHRARIW